MPKTARHFIFQAVRGGATEADDKGDISIDNIKLELEKCLDGTESNISIFTHLKAVNQARYYLFLLIFLKASISSPATSSQTMPALPFKCHFGLRAASSMSCGFEQDNTDHFDWTVYDNGTPTDGTGPATKLSRGKKNLQSNLSYLLHCVHMFFTFCFVFFLS